MAQQTLQGAQNDVVQQDGRLNGILEAAYEDAGLPPETEAKIENGRVVVPSWQPPESQVAKQGAKQPPAK